MRKNRGNYWRTNKQENKEHEKKKWDKKFLKSRDASVEVTQTEVLHCIYIICKEVIHSAFWMVCVLALTPITNTHLASSSKTPHLNIGPLPVCFCTSLGEEMPSINHFIPKKVSSSWDCGTTKETSRRFQKRNGKTVIIEEVSWCL